MDEGVCLEMSVWKFWGDDLDAVEEEDDVEDFLIGREIPEVGAILSLISCSQGDVSVSPFKNARSSVERTL